MSSLWQRSNRHWAWVSEQWRFWSVVIIKTLPQAWSNESYLFAASIGYYTLFSLFPLTILTVAMASLWLDPILIEKDLITQLEFVAPELGSLFGDNIDALIRARAPVSSFAALFLLWSASNVFHVLTQAMDSVWKVHKSRNAWRHRGLAMLSVLIISGLLLMTLFTESTFFTILNSLIPKEWEPFRPYTNRFLTLALSIALFTVLYYVLPHINLTWRQVLPGAFVAGLAWEIAKLVFQLFISVYLTRSNLIYGSVTTIIAFLTWTYVSGIIFMMGGYFNVETDRQRKRRAKLNQERFLSANRPAEAAEER